MDQHNAAVGAIAARAQYFFERKLPFRIYHGSTNSTRPISFQRNAMINTSSLNHVIKVSPEEQTVLVEPNVPMDRLVQATLAHGLVPPVVMEFPGITVGGGFAGTSGESSSFKYGFFDKIVNWIEIVLPNGDIVQASNSKLPDLFHGAAGSFGTLGVTTLLELRLIKAKPYVELTYCAINSPADAVAKIDVAAADPSLDYLDGIMFSHTSGVIMTGKLVDNPDSDMKVQRFTHSHDPWFYVHAQRLIQKSKTATEAVPLTDYLFRYDRGAFWTGVYAFKYFLVPFNRITCWALDSFMHTRVMYQALHESGFGDRYLIQDLALPRSQAEAFMDYVEDSFGIYPLWLCPLRAIPEGLSFHPHSSRQEMLINVGVWGPGPTDRKAFLDVNRQLEKKVTQLNGMKWLYAHAYYTEEEFWQIYDREWYEGLRTKYHAEALPSVYEKVKVDLSEKGKQHSLIWAVWPLSGLYGVWRTMVARNYLVDRKRSSFAGLVVLLFFFVGIIAILMAIFSTDKNVRS